MGKETSGKVVGLGGFKYSCTRNGRVHSIERFPDGIWQDTDGSVVGFFGAGVSGSSGCAICHSTFGGRYRAKKVKGESGDIIFEER